MTERFYCVGCKSHYELPVQEAVKKPSKGGSYRHSIVSQCPKGHKTTRICNADLYADYHDSKSAESPLTEGPIPDGPPSEPTPVPSATQSFSSRCEVHEAEFEACGCDKDAETGGRTFEEQLPHLSPADIKKIKEISADIDAAVAAGDYKKADELMEKFKHIEKFDSESFEATQVVGTMSPGVNLEALTPVEGGMENGYEDSMVPADSFLPEGSGHVIGSQSTSHNYTPMHAETFDADELYPYYELREVTNGTWGDVVGDWDGDQEEMALAVWEQSVNDDGPYILVYWKDTESDGAVVAGDFFLEAENVNNAEETGSRNNKAAIATAAAAIVIGLVWWKNRQE
jgi:hypothetical protein